MYIVCWLERFPEAPTRPFSSTSYIPPSQSSWWTKILDNRERAKQTTHVLSEIYEKNEKKKQQNYHKQQQKGKTFKYPVRTYAFCLLYYIYKYIIYIVKRKGKMMIEKTKKIEKNPILDDKTHVDVPLYPSHVFINK